MLMSVCFTDSVTIVRKKGDRDERFIGKAVVIREKKLSFVVETATVQAQEQRAKDAKSFRRLYASDYNSMLIS